MHVVLSNHRYFFLVESGSLHPLKKTVSPQRYFVKSTLKSYNQTKQHVSRTCAVSGGQGGRGNPIKVIVNGAGGELGRAAIAAISAARGMQLVGAIDKASELAGQDAGELAGLGEPLEIPVTSDMLMVLASIANARATGVLVDLEPGEEAYENIRQAAAFGLKSVVLSESMALDKVKTLQEFCEKASAGCILAPTFHVGTALLHQSALTAAFSFASVDIIESSEEGVSEPSVPALQLAAALSDLGKLFQPSFEAQQDGTFTALGEDGVNWKGLQTSSNNRLEVRFSAPGQALSFAHEAEDARAMVPGLLLAIRKVMRLKTMVYGIERIL